MVSSFSRRKLFSHSRRMESAFSELLILRLSVQHQLALGENVWPVGAAFESPTHHFFRMA